MLEIVITIMLGVFTGIITGLTPGLHPNTVIFSSIPFYFNSKLSFSIYASFISGISVSHTFHDFIPSIFLGVPEPDSALAALPGQKMAMRGRGREGFVFTVYGGLYAMLTAFPASVLFYFFLEDFYKLLESQMHLLLLFFLAVIVFNSESIFDSVLTASLSASLGLIAFQAPVNQQYVLIPIFGGMFAFPSVWNALKQGRKVPEQNFIFGGDGYRRGGFLGFLASVPVALLPGTSNSVSTAFLWPLVDSRKKFLSAVGGANTSDIFLSFLTLMLLGRARSGASVAVQTLGKTDAALMVVGASIFAVGLSAPVSILTLRAFLGSGFHSYQELLALVALLTVVVFSFYLTGFAGLLIFAVASAVGFFAAFTGNRHSCMSVLLVPAILFFSPQGFI
ncbi:MAG: tripartite tricarboxylate transporter permease [Candidatus Nanohaloarchaea archaeon]